MGKQAIGHNPTMIIFPAIDIKNGKVVRLLQGRFDDVTEYSTDPVQVARQWMNNGAKWLHIVDLDGAQSESIKNYETIANVAKSVDAQIQMGGGIRTESDIAQLFEAGISRVILGTRIVKDKDFLKTILDKWGERIAVSLDCSNGMVAQRGWTEVTDVKAVDFSKELESLGLRYLIYTDIATDGMLTGPNLDGLNDILDAVNISVIASGGIADIEDIKKLRALESKGLIGAITGKAIYEGTLDLEGAIKLCSQNG